MKNKEEFSQEDIENIIYALNQLGQTIIKMNKLLSALPTEELKDPYYNEINDLTYYFVDRRKKLRGILEGYFEKEKEEGRPVNFSFRRVYRSLEDL